MSSTKSLKLVLILVGLLLIGFVFYSRANKQIVKIQYSNLLGTVEKNDYSIVYFGTLLENRERAIRETITDNRIKFYQTTTTLEEINILLREYNFSSTKENIFVLFIGDSVVGVIQDFESQYQFYSQVRKYFFNEIPTEEIAYKTLNKADDYIKKFNSKNYTVAVFGYEGCTHCTLYLPVINEIAHEQLIDVYYFDRDHYDENEYNKIMELDFEIPSKCTKDGVATTSTNAFPKPMTIISRKGKVVDCIMGNVKKEEVLQMLKKYKIVKRK